MAIGLTTLRACRDVSRCFFYHGNPFTFFLDFQNKFAVIHQEYSVNKSRELKSEGTLSSVHLLSDSTSVHFTSVTDTRRTATIIQRGEYGGPTTRCADNEMCAVREIIITANLKSVQLM